MKKYIYIAVAGILALSECTKINDDYSAPFYFSGRLFKASIDVER